MARPRVRPPGWNSNLAATLTPRSERMLDLMIVRSGALPSELAAEAGLSKSWANRVSRSPVFQRALSERRAALRAALDGEIVQTYSRALCEVRERLDAGKLSERGLLDVLDALGRLVAAPACGAQPSNNFHLHATAEQITAARRLMGAGGRVPAKLPAPTASGLVATDTE
jgi:hypothetical protein